MENLTPEQVVEKINGLVSEKLSGAATKSELDDLKNQLDGFKSLELKSDELVKAIAKMEGKLEAINEKAITKITPKNLAQSLSMAFAEKHADIQNSINDGKVFNLEVKAAGDTTITGDYTGNVALSVLEPGVNRPKRQVVKVRNIVNAGTTTSKFVTYVAQTTTSTSVWTAEGVAKTVIEPKYEEISEEVKKIAGTIRISKEMLADLAFIQSEINTDLMESIEAAIENSLINGAGGADLNGLLSIAQVFVPGTFAGSVVNANLSDVIRIAISQIQDANFEPTHVVLNPADFAAMQLTKTNTGEYTYPMFLMDANGQHLVANLPVVTTSYMAAGTYLVGDFSKSNVRVREGVNMQVGYVNDDFQRNMVTILAEARLVHYVKANDANAFVYGDISTDIAAIND
jgi:HK97 family phage major capsid protein